MEGAEVMNPYEELQAVRLGLIGLSRFGSRVCQCLTCIVLLKRLNTSKQCVSLGTVQVLQASPVRVTENRPVMLPLPVFYAYK